jgi:hypothetical protein
MVVGGRQESYMEAKERFEKKRRSVVATFDHSYWLKIHAHAWKNGG